MILMGFSIDRIGSEATELESKCGSSQKPFSGSQSNGFLIWVFSFIGDVFVVWAMPVKCVIVKMNNNLMNEGI